MHVYDKMFASLIILLMLGTAFVVLDNSNKPKECDLYNRDFDNYFEFIIYEILVDDEYLTDILINSNGSMSFNNNTNMKELSQGPLSFAIENPESFSFFIFIEQEIMQLRSRPETSCKFIQANVIQIDYYELHDAEFRYIIDLDDNLLRSYSITDSFGNGPGDWNIIEFNFWFAWYDWNPDNINFTFPLEVPNE